ncbi:MAG: tRNA 2-thiouridine(34) synthase MnmA [Thermoleophilia bacterium]|nr:tRNA 2-thiouridine(34) synthase MnmA [Thermoleophilia bacterium]
MSEARTDMHTAGARSATVRHYGARVVAHVARPRGAGRLSSPDGVGTAGDPSCGDQVRIELRVQHGRVTAARFQAFGCPATIAGGSEVVSRVEGRTVFDAAQLSEAMLADALELSSAKRACSNLAADALHAALEDVIGRGLPLRPADMATNPEGVLVAMSGGVDSATAALMLTGEGRQVIGVTFRFWSDPTCGPGGGCCSPETVVRARRAAHTLGIPHFTVDLGGPFYREVVEYFVREYAGGRTPNPCVRCNGSLRFGELVSLADRMGLGSVATGHYAQLAGNPPLLQRGTDPQKDQSYVLARVPPGLLQRARFPLGLLTKAQVRSIAREAGLEAHDAVESQEICFIPDNDHRRFLRERLGDRPGDIIDPLGNVLGRHAGIHNFTVGQRKGLGIAAAQPLYVTAVVFEDDAVVAAPRQALAVNTIVVDDLVRHVRELPSRVWAQLRSSGGPIRSGLDDRGSSLVLHLAEPVVGVAPGQTAVVYAETAVVAAGTIVSARMSGENPVL